MKIENKQIKGNESKIKNKKYHFTPEKGRPVIIEAESQEEANKIYNNKHKRN